MLPRPDRPALLRSFVGSLGGKDLSLGEFRGMVEALERGRPEECPDGPELLYTEADWRQVQPLLKLAQAPRPQSEEATA